jgi:hypothetical protein
MRYFANSVSLYPSFLSQLLIGEYDLDVDLDLVRNFRDYSH